MTRPTSASAGAGEDPPTDPELTAYHEICAYTLTLGDGDFLHQHVVDAFAAQRAKEGDKPIGLTMSLVGLFLRAERGFSGRQVQRAHMQLARRERPWPHFVLPADRGAITATQVLAASPGPERNQAIHAWAEAVWNAYGEINRLGVVALLRDGGIL